MTRGRRRTQRFLLGWLAWAGVAASLGSAPTAAQAGVSASRQLLEARVLAVRAVIRQHSPEHPEAMPDDKLAQWMNWGNWSNWNNWPNWGNWGNWLNR